MNPNILFNKLASLDKEITKLKEKQVNTALTCVQSLAHFNNTTEINQVLEELKESQLFYILAPIVRWLGTEYDANYYEDWYENYAFADDR